MEDNYLRREMDKSNTSIVHLFCTLDNGVRRTEEVLVEVLDENRFRVLKSPGVVLGIAAGDEFSLSNDSPEGYELLRRGGNICVQLYVEGKKGEECRRILEPLSQKLDGRLDGYQNFPETSILVFTFPLKAGFDHIKNFAETGRTIAPVDYEWYYGNVYDIVDGVTPLNWWISAKHG